MVSLEKGRNEQGTIKVIEINDQLLFTNSVTEGRRSENGCSKMKGATKCHQYL